MTGETPNSKIRKLPQNVLSNQELVEEALALGCLKAKIIMTRTIALAHWVKFQCQYGCPHFGKLLTCPPYAPTSDEMGEILMDYSKALLVQIKPAANDREIVIHLERICKQKGFFKAFGLCSSPCDLCETCTVDTQCKHPDRARPTMKACGINLPEILFDSGWSPSGLMSHCSHDHGIGMVLID